MANVFVVGSTIILLVLVCRYFSKWHTNHQEAKTIGLNVYLSPIHISDAWWMALYPFLLPILEHLPKQWTNPWLPMAQVWQLWRNGHRPFAEVDAESFVIATPNGNMLWSSDHAIVNQIFTLHPKLVVPVEMMAFFDIWGPNVGSVEGEEWKAHRRVITAGFGSAINATVWAETQRQTETLIHHWLDMGAVVPRVLTWTSRLALHIISCGFFNVKLGWDEEVYDEARIRSTGHTLPLDQAMRLMMGRLATITVTPRSLLGRLPGKMFKEANLGYTEVTKYFQELRNEAEVDIENILKKKSKTLLESIVVAGTDFETSKVRYLSDDSVLGNIFITLMAGHETTGCTLGFIFMFMALYPDMQKKIQKQLDQHFSNRPKNEWTLERDYHPLQSGYIGAVQKEVLTIYHPASFMLRKTVETVTVTDSSDRKFTIPPNTLTPIPFQAAFQNPRLWKKRQVPAEQIAKTSDSPALYFDPDRWLDTNAHSHETSNDKPGRYAEWWGYGLGPRACPGRALAQVEIAWAMATLFKDYSLELVVDAHTLEQCKGDHTRAWEDTRDRAMKAMYEDIRQNVSISVDRDVPIRVVKRHL